MSDDAKCAMWLFGIPMIFICLVIGTSTCVGHYSKAIEAKSAMENGYEEVLLETGEIVWQKVN